MKIFADVFMWAVTLSVPFLYAAPFAMKAAHRTPAKITAAICASSVIMTLAAFGAWWLR